MLRSQKVFFRASKADLDRLYACNRESVRVWNECLRLAKEHFLQYGRWITKSELQKQTKRKFHLHSQSIQTVCHQYLFARQAAHHALQQGHPARYPYKKKKYFPTKWAKDGFKVYENGKELQIQESHSRKGNCYDNSCIESFFSHLKTEKL
ncbi:hypothetical protein [Saccharococcus caldoxylosilyticus]|jgi:putative transposase|uniref:hypothetical protein n=1 Tax=Saccharococcus caldoxylosilyticus TaxID=81408 RepID=UPI000474C8AD|nr:hypothetical protein [Parageobacillus caldoxylosilyticus]